MSETPTTPPTEDGAWIVARVLPWDELLAAPLAGGPIRRVRRLPGGDAVRGPAAEALRAATGVDGKRWQDTPDVGADAHGLWLARAPRAGVRLDAVIAALAARGEQAPLDFAAWVGLELSKALHDLHARATPRGQALGWRHEHVAPAAVWLDDEGGVRLDPWGVGPRGEPVPGAPEADADDVVATADVVRQMLAGGAVQDAPAVEVLPWLPHRVATVLDEARAGTVSAPKTFGARLRDAALRGTDREALKRAFVQWRDELVPPEDRLTNADVAAATAAVARARAARATAAREAAVARVARARRRAGLIVAVLVLLAAVGLGAWGARLRPAPPRVALVETGRIEISVGPPAVVSVDGDPRGQGEHVEIAGLTPGRHEVRLEAPQHEPAVLQVVVPRGGRVKLTRRLTPIVEGKRPALAVRSRPFGARVTLDGRYIGTTPLAIEPEPTEGPARIVVQKVGFQPEVRRFTLDEGRRYVVDVLLVPEGAAPGSLRVLLYGARAATVFVDGERLAQPAPFEDVSVPAGTHEIRVVDEASGLDHTETVVVGSGRRSTVRVR